MLQPVSKALQFSKSSLTSLQHSFSALIWQQSAPKSFASKMPQDGWKVLRLSKLSSSTDFNTVFLRQNGSRVTLTPPRDGGKALLTSTKFSDTKMPTRWLAKKKWSWSLFNILPQMMKKSLLLCNQCSLTDFYIVFGIKLPQDGIKASLWLLSSPSTHSNITGWHRNVARWWPNASFVQMKLFNSPAELSGTTMSQDSCKALLLSNGLSSTHLNQILWRHDFSTTLKIAIELLCYRTVFIIAFASIVNQHENAKLAFGIGKAKLPSVQQAFLFSQVIKTRRITSGLGYLTFLFFISVLLLKCWMLAVFQHLLPADNQTNKRSVQVCAPPSSILQ